LHKIGKYTEIEIYETQIQIKDLDGEVISCSLEKRELKSLADQNVTTKTFTLNKNLISNGQLISKKQDLTQSEYDQQML
jgi:hypothetical protein